MVITTVTRIQEVFSLFLGLLIEAFPFIVLGVFLSTFIAFFVKEEWILRYIPKNKYLSHPMIALLGIFLPVCECGNVPLARRLLASKFSASQSITFLLAAPIVNPITFITTLEAFNLNPAIAVFRILLGYIIAVFIGLYFSYEKKEDLLQEKFMAEVCNVESNYHHNWSYSLKTFQSEFIEVFKMLCIGALIAALAQTLVPREALVSIGTHPILSVLAMLLMAFVISICSNVDAFFALSYSNTFTTGSLLTFMLFGPMIDIKILSMLKSTFKIRTLVILTTLIAIITVFIGIVMNLRGSLTS